MLREVFGVLRLLREELRREGWGVRRERAGTAVRIEGRVELNPSVTLYVSRNRLLCKPLS